MIGFDDRAPNIQTLMKELNDVNNGLMGLVKDEAFIPNKRDLYLLRQMNKRYHQGFAITYYVERRLTQRLKERWGTPEPLGKGMPDFSHFEDPDEEENP